MSSATCTPLSALPASAQALAALAMLAAWSRRVWISLRYTLIAVSAMAASMGILRRLDTTTNARLRHEVERKLSNLMAHLPACGSSCDALARPTCEAANQAIL